MFFPDPDNEDDIRIYSVGVWNISAVETAVRKATIRIYSVGVWNLDTLKLPYSKPKLEFNPLEFENG